ncbi:MAG: transcription-repair coupling factor [Verrucomicrobia bacterium]|nr:transcription-repair coupling factor [Verrucomicrobiota bacterium]
MENVLLQTVQRIASGEPLASRLRQPGPVTLEHVCSAAQGFVVACAAHERPLRAVWVVCPDPRRQEEIFNALLNWQINPLFLPELEIPAVPDAVPDPEILAERLELLQKVAEGKRFVVVLTLQTLGDQVPAPQELTRQTRIYQRGQVINRDAFVAELIEAGYEQVPQVNGRGQFAVRGGILDVFSAQHATPVRIELFGDEIDSIRAFDLDEQTSIQVLERCEILTGNPDGAETVCVRDYIRSGDLTVDVEAGWEEAAVRVAAGTLASGEIEDYSTAFYPSGFETFEAGDFLVEEHKREAALNQLRRWLAERWEVLAICHNEGETERLRDVLNDNEVDVESIRFVVGNLDHGFTFPGSRLAVLSDSEIFGRYQSPSARRLALRRARLRGGRAPIDFSELAPGDLVVHVEYGIGKYRGVQELDQQGTQQEVVVLEFADDARLYVPFEQAYLISRYVGIGRKYPPLSSLGDQRWAKAKKAAETAVFDYAARLLSVQAERHTLSGFAFPPDTKWQADFESAFLYKETGDQLRAIEATKHDMESEQPMDRLICGDVGFGKTEVAIRAAFKAVMSGKQVVMLCPTTVLAQQHFNTFRERMSDYPIKIGMLSRFLSTREQRETLAGVRNGDIDIVIGTLRLTSGDVGFKDLGLVVIDEEQRFGVRHKERFKERFKLVDVLTLSATPIPRTLYLSLVGAKDMSIIETPPPNRLPVETIVCGYDERVIRDAIQRELHRKGQVFFLHNRVQSAERVRERIQHLCPGARVDIGHGQMEEQDLEEVMERFVRGETDVLVSTTIIESGLDIPNANTIIIDRADQFGLADLYQLRGRVGRAQHKAYAFLLLPREIMTVGAARRRVNAIKQYSGLGAGFKIAMRDLEIRGAGNILGTAQSGHIVNVGFDLYCQLLQQAVDKLKGGKRGRAQPHADALVRCDFVAVNEAEYLRNPSELVPAFIPADYVSQPQMRIQAYKKLAQVTSREQLDQLGKEWRDRYGPHPPAVRNLLLLNEIKLAAAHRKIVRVEVKENKVMMTRGGDYILIGNRFPRLTSADHQNNLPDLLSLVSRLS